MGENYQEKIKDGRYLPLMEDFYTIQGEGYHTGKAAYFIRIGGCDVGCSWCDTKFSWNALKFPPVASDEVIKKIITCPARAVVVTGGEPSMYNLDYFTSELKKNNIQTFVETSGAYPLSGAWDWICLSPKKQSPPRKEIFSRADELKVIIHEDSDFAWAEENAKKVNNSCKLYLQPEWSVAPKIISRIVDYVMKDPGWNVSLQSHKYMRIP
ncbi:MAG: 7-carboxy-7-deazaguanine synthase QueE [Bacteroidales bacterium]|nr:7-carboxy-7-deazaguanine synthase QueE [Bacteroidales bacterium]MCF8399254.1 7-carboxy-7-deazaguanine synthase QueE [Bacteroidales bacterium]